MNILDNAPMRRFMSVCALVAMLCGIMMMMSQAATAADSGVVVRNMVPAGSVSTFDVSPWVQMLVGIASVSVPAFLTVIGVWAKAHFKLAANSNAANIIDLMVTAGTQTVQGVIAKAPATVNPITIKNDTVAKYLNTISDGAQAAMKIKGVTAADIANRIDGALSAALTPAMAETPASSSSTSVKG